MHHVTYQMIELDKRNIFCLKDFKENIQKFTPSTSEKRQQIKKNRNIWPLSLFKGLIFWSLKGLVADGERTSLVKKYSALGPSFHEQTAQGF